jgi:ubiquinone/menaquinone biosynthesis C-methylase UbiE
MKSERTFLPAAGRDLFLPVYDPLVKLLGFDRLRRALLDQAALRPDDRVLDVGCGTGTLAVLIKRLYPRVEVVALDPDPRALARAQRKADRAGVSVRFDQGFADALGYADATFDRVFSSMMFHHLDTDSKDRVFREVRRVLKPRGRLEFLDFADPGMHGHGVLAHLVHGHRQVRDNADDRILNRMARAGLVDRKKVGDRGTLFGRLGFFQASAPQ